MNLLTKKWYSLADKLRFAIIGIFNASVMYLIYTIFIFILGEAHYQKALCLAWIISSITSFLTHKYWVFHAKGNIIKEYLKCCSTWVISYFINAILLEVFINCAHINVFISQIIAPAIAGIFTYFMFKKIAFRKRKRKRNEK